MHPKSTRRYLQQGVPFPRIEAQRGYAPDRLHNRSYYYDRMYDMIKFVDKLFALSITEASISIFSQLAYQ